MMFLHLGAFGSSSGNPASKFAIVTGCTRCALNLAWLIICAECILAICMPKGLNSLLGIQSNSFEICGRCFVMHVTMEQADSPRRRRINALVNSLQTSDPRSFTTQTTPGSRCARGRSRCNSKFQNKWMQ